jgi:hypothetical protein
MIRIWLSLVIGLALMLSGGCAREEPRPVELQVGQHRISLMLPEGWEHIDYGDRHQLRSDLKRISIEALDRIDNDLDESVEDALDRLKESERRDEASRNRFELAGHEAVVVDTWDKLSHQYRKRFLFVRVREELLTIYMMRGEFDAMEAVFDSLVASLALVDSLGVAGPDVRESEPE